MQKMRLFHQLALEKCLIQNSCKLSGYEYFGLYLWNNIFPKEKICTGTQQIIYILIIEEIQRKNIWPVSPIFEGKKCFPKKSGSHNVIRFSSTMPKF